MKAVKWVVIPVGCVVAGFIICKLTTKPTVKVETKTEVKTEVRHDVKYVDRIIYRRSNSASTTIRYRSDGTISSKTETKTASDSIGGERSKSSSIAQSTARTEQRTIETNGSTSWSVYGIMPINSFNSGKVDWNSAKIGVSYDLTTHLFVTAQSDLKGNMDIGAGIRF